MRAGLSPTSLAFGAIRVSKVTANHTEGLPTSMWAVSGKPQNPTSSVQRWRVVNPRRRIIHARCPKAEREPQLFRDPIAPYGQEDSRRLRGQFWRSRNAATTPQILPEIPVH